MKVTVKRYRVLGFRDAKIVVKLPFTLSYKEIAHSLTNSMIHMNRDLKSLKQIFL